MRVTVFWVGLMRRGVDADDLRAVADPREHVADAEVVGRGDAHGQIGSDVHHVVVAGGQRERDVRAVHVVGRIAAVDAVGIRESQLQMTATAVASAESRAT